MNNQPTHQESSSVQDSDRQLWSSVGGCGCETRERPRLKTTTFFLASCTLIAGGLAAFFAGIAVQARSHAMTDRDVSSFIADLPIAMANSAVSSEKFSIATGMISEQTEGLFVLDHNSGLLQCTVMYPRMGRFMATFSINVAESLGATAKGGSYIMVTGIADFPRSSDRPVGLSVVYVLDTTTGVYGCYGIPFDRQALSTNRPQQGSLVLIAQGSGNPILDRDSLR